MSIALDDGSRVAVIGGGPAGSLFAFFLLNFAQQMDLDIEVDIYESRDFSQSGPAGCNMCGGIVSESLIQMLALEGINLPETVVQRGIDSYVLHTNDESLRIDTPLHEQRIAAVHRGGGPRGPHVLQWGGLDGFLLSQAQEMGAKVLKERITGAAWDGDRPQLSSRTGSQTYDLVAGAAGINFPSWQLFEELGFKCERPRTARAYITELALGYDTITKYLGSSMHMFLLDMPRLDCAAIIPKGEFATVCLLGSDIDHDLVDAFFNSPAVRRCLPPDMKAEEGICHCGPRINVGEAAVSAIDRVVLVGDCGVARLYKDGIGSAYRTAKAAALTAIFSGVSAEDFQRHFSPAYRGIAVDNRFGMFMFGVVHYLKSIRPLLKGVMRMTAREQQSRGSAGRMSSVLWDMFTGSRPYRDVFKRTLDPRFGAQLLLQTALALGGRQRRQGGQLG